MSEKFDEQFDGLLEKYTELLLGESNDERKEQVQKWALYSYIAKTMPALVKHWNETYPDAKEEMVALIADIKQLNDEYRKKQVAFIAAYFLYRYNVYFKKETVLHSTELVEILYVSIQVDRVKDTYFKCRKIFVYRFSRYNACLSYFCKLSK